MIDNSGSMARPQARLSADIDAFIDVLEQGGADYRIGFTTTDVGNAACSAASTTPESGSLVLRSCVDRVDLGEFIYNLEDGSYACSDHCTLSDFDLATTPTTTQYDDKPAPRRWIERSAPGSNLPAGVSVADAFRCFAPQGVIGCGFEAHLEAMHLALSRAADPGSPGNYGFLRDDAALAVIIVSDELDCSGNPAYKEIFTPANRIFWEDPNDPQATSAVCWFAGVRCQGDGPVYPSCVAADYDANGNIADDPDDAVLWPVSRYTDFLQTLAEQKHGAVSVALLAGVPEGYDQGLSELVYEDGTQEIQNLWGIGPGCAADEPEGLLTGLPPVRMRELAAAFAEDGERNLYSICQASYAASLARMAAKIRDATPPTCMPKCVKDSDPETPILDPNCLLHQTDTMTDTGHDIVQCLLVDGAWQMPADEEVCYVMHIDQNGQTPGTHDDMSMACVSQGYNLEFELRRTTAAGPHITVSARCDVSSNSASDCPNL